MKKFFAAIALLALTACKGPAYTGRLVLRSDVQMKTKSGAVIVESGTYEATVEASRSTLHLTLVNKAGDVLPLELKVNRIKDKLNDNPFHISAKDMGQAFSLAGSETKEDNSKGCDGDITYTMNAQLIAVDSTVLGEAQLIYRMRWDKCYVPDPMPILPDIPIHPKN